MRNGRSVLITCCGLFYLTKRERERERPAAQGREKERIVGELCCVFLLLCTSIYSIRVKVFLALQGIRDTIG